MATTTQLNNGNLMPAIGLGTYQLIGTPRIPGEIREAVKYGIEVGYRHIDGAAVYRNEKEVGDALEAKIADGTVKRAHLFITSKLWNTKHRPELVVPACKQTLADLKLDYLDLYLIHWPFAFKEGDEDFPRKGDAFETTEIDYVDTWKQMEECVRLGLTKSIGVSNFNSKQLTRILEVAKIKPVTNQVECHPYLNQKKLIRFCKDRGIVITAHTPLANPAKIPKNEVPLVQDPNLKKLADKYGKTIPQVVLRYLIQVGTVPIPKSVHKERIKENFDVFDFQLSDEEMGYVDSLNRNLRLSAIIDAKDATHYPFKEEF